MEQKKSTSSAKNTFNSIYKVKLLSANESSIDLLKALKSAEFEIEHLKEYILNMKSRIACYIPVKDDLLDRKLAEYINFFNNFPDRHQLKIMFMRLVKCEMGKIAVRVGGGYLSIDEFLDQYTPTEVEKLERTNPVKRFNERVAV